MFFGGREGVFNFDFLLSDVLRDTIIIFSRYQRLYLFFAQW